MLTYRPEQAGVREKDYGKYQPNQRLNVDQVPLNLDSAAARGFIPPEADSVVQLTGQPGADKRFGTAQLCIHGGLGPQPKLTLFFRGKSTALARERARYHPDVNVLFQENAWADAATVTQWARTSLQQHVQENLDDKPFVLYQGNPKAQKDPGYQQVVRDLGGLCAYGPRGMTEGWQPIDAVIHQYARTYTRT